ncbi:MAG: hypothetical protein IID52_07770, partial [Proteobacteria bacterium]|nr:hypothetical protein [Pseudomonadota bacterium]
MYWLSYFWKIIWKEAGKIIRTLYFGTMIVPGGIGLSLGLPMIEWVGLSVVATLVILLTQTINRAKALTEKMEPKLSVVLKDGEMIIEASLSAQAISTLYKIVLKNSGGEPIKRGNLIYRQLHYSKKPTRRARIEPTNKFVKQTENGALFGGKAIVPQKTYFSLNRDEEIEFDAFLLQEYRVDNRKGSQQLIYYGVA